MQYCFIIPRAKRYISSGQSAIEILQMYQVYQSERYSFIDISKNGNILEWLRDLKYNKAPYSNTYLSKSIYNIIICFKISKLHLHHFKNTINPIG